MKNNMKFASIMVVILVTVLTVQSVFAGNLVSKINSAFADKSDLTVAVTLNGNKITFPDAQPFIDNNNRTLVPIRFVAEAMGTDVKWEENGKIETVTLRKGNKIIDLKIGEYGATVNGQRWALDTAAILKEDRTFVPLRFVSEIIGATVGWDESTNTVSITDSSIVVTPKPVSTPTPTPKVVPTPTPTPGTNYTAPIFTPTYHTPDPNAVYVTPTPNPIPSQGNPILGKPYFGLTIKDASDLERFTKLKPLFNYDDVIAIMGDPDGLDNLQANVSYGWYNPLHKGIEGYLTISTSETNNFFKIQLKLGTPKALNRLREVINIAFPIDDQNFKDTVYNTMLSCKDGYTGGINHYGDNSFFIQYDNPTEMKKIYGEDAFVVTAWGSGLK